MSFSPEELSRDAFLDGRLWLWQPRRGYRAAIDPVLLAAFVPARPGQRVLELGCGAGVAALCLAARVPGLELHGLELQPDYAALARRNAAENGAALTVHEGDLRRPPAALRIAFDHVLANPPFHSPAAPAAVDPGRDRAHREGEAGLADWIAAGLHRLVPGGRLALIHRPERLGDTLAALQGRAGVEVVPIVPRAERPANRVLVRARKGSKAALRIWPSLTLHEGRCHLRDGESYTAAAQGVLRGMAALLPDARAGDRASCTVPAGGAREG
jgi:tRNA1(Val) A37 N6-methylase TrmN6